MGKTPIPEYRNMLTYHKLSAFNDLQKLVLIKRVLGDTAEITSKSWLYISKFYETVYGCQKS